ncbi:hypothetical protein C8F04DRAFT_1153218, partial [Mycena alexandri]
RGKLLNAKVDAAINSNLKDFKSPRGIGVAVVQKSPESGWIVETKGYGVAKVDGTNLFDILATGLLISNEKWGLMDPIASSESTIVDVMSGLPQHDFILQHGTVADVIRRLRYLKPSTGFRELWQYNNHIHSLLLFSGRQIIPVLPIHQTSGGSPRNASSPF